MISDGLQRMGFTEHEALVYEAVLKLGPTAALAVSRKTGIKRTTVYDTLDRLVHRGLVRVELRGLKRLFAPADPDRFDALMDEQRKEFERILPEMSALYKLKGERTLIKLYQGVAGLQTALELVLSEIRTNDFWYVIDDQHNWERSLDIKWLEGLIERRARKDVDFRIIFPDSERGRMNKKMEGAWRQKVRLITKPVHADITITPYRYVIHSFKNPITTISIEDPEIVETQKNLFLALWDSLPD